MPVSWGSDEVEKVEALVLCSLLHKQKLCLWLISANVISMPQLKDTFSYFLFYRSSVMDVLLIFYVSALYIWATTWQNQQNECAPSEH